MSPSYTRSNLREPRPMPDTHTKDGFLIRGAEMTRLETFVDAAFAFAVTLLVVGGGDNIPTSYEEFGLAMQRVPAFALSFANIVFFWYAHYTWSRRYGLEDATSTILSLILIFIVLVYVYPLLAIYSGAFLFLPAITPETAFVYRSLEDFQAVLVIFGLGFSCLSGVIALLNWHALRVGDAIGLSPTERFDTVTTLLLWLALTLVPLGSVILAPFADSEGLAKLAGGFYAVFAIVIPAIKISRMRMRRTLVATLAKGASDSGSEAPG